jgi:hypothetical protein
MENEPVRIDYKDKQEIVLMGKGRKCLFIEKEPGMIVPMDQYGIILFKEEYEKFSRGADQFFSNHKENQISRHNDRENLELNLFEGMNNLNQVPYRKIEEYENGLKDLCLNHKYHIQTVLIREEILSESEWEIIRSI